VLLTSLCAFQVQVYSLSLIFYLWNKPHYRNGTFQDDMVRPLFYICSMSTCALSLANWIQCTCKSLTAALCSCHALCTFKKQVKNLRNVAIPGTGVPLSLMCILKVLDTSDTHASAHVRPSLQCSASKRITLLC
jgi:hypothetical protein